MNMEVFKMDMFKKVMSGILALSLCVGVGSVNVNAASTYKKGDIDGNERNIHHEFFRIGKSKIFST